MTEQSELLACPLCGPGKVYLNPPSKEYRFGSINCPGCMLTLPGEISDPREMIEVWNTRAPAQSTRMPSVVYVVYGWFEQEYEAKEPSAVFASEQAAKDWIALNPSDDRFVPTIEAFDLRGLSNATTTTPVVHQINGPFASPVLQAEGVTTPCEQIPGTQHPVAVLPPPLIGAIVAALGQRARLMPNEAAKQQAISDLDAFKAWADAQERHAAPSAGAQHLYGTGEAEPVAGPKWPSGCHSTSSCIRHRRCMYIQCRHSHQDVSQDIDAALKPEGK